MPNLTCPECGGTRWQRCPVFIPVGPFGERILDFAEECAGCGFLASTPPRTISVDGDWGAVAYAGRVRSLK